MRWVVDDGPFGLLARYFDPSWAWPASALDVVESVAAAGAADKSGRRQLLLNATSSGAPVIAVHGLVIGSRAAAIVLDYLRRTETRATKNLGEDESVAFCMEDAPDGIFVTMDRRAAFIALAELGPGRVATAFDLWNWLESQRMLDARIRTALDESTLKQDSGLPGVPRRLRRQ